MLLQDKIVLPAFLRVLGRTKATSADRGNKDTQEYVKESGCLVKHKSDKRLYLLDEAEAERFAKADKNALFVCMRLLKSGLPDPERIFFFSKAELKPVHE